MFKTTTYDLNNQNQQTKDVYSWIAGKVYGNTTINMEGGWVMRSIFGGGNLGSVGKGNYTGGADDYYAQGYGETLTGNLWDGESNLSQEFLNSGKSTVNIWGGKLGFLLSSTTKVNQAFDNTPETTVGSEYSKYIKACTKDDLPTGNVFGASRGEAVADITQAEEAVYTNRPDLYLGYVNETYVNIGRPAVGEEGQEGYIPASGVRLEFRTTRRIWLSWVRLVPTTSTGRIAVMFMVPDPVLACLRMAIPKRTVRLPVR